MLDCRKGGTLFTQLLKEFQSNGESHERTEETYFEICRFPHYENVVSNVLAYFLDDENHHNLDGLVAKSLFQACEFQDLAFDTQFLVEREVRTDKGKYIDILLSNEACSIVIENKIWAPLDNDLHDYLSYARSRNSNTRGIVLSMRQIKTGNKDFINVTYSKFLAEIRRNIGSYISHNSTQNLNLLVHLINTLENLESGVKMNNEFVEFLKTNPEKVEELASELKLYHDDLRKTVVKVNAIVRDKIQQLSVKQWHVRTLPKLHDICVSDFITIDDKAIAIDSVVNFGGWEFQVFPRGKVAGNISPSDLLDYCNSCNIDGKIQDTFGGKRFVLLDKPTLETEIVDVAEKIANLITALKPKQV